MLALRQKSIEDLCIRGFFAHSLNVGASTKIISKKDNGLGSLFCIIFLLFFQTTL
jgi:hypothetical protein